VALGARELTRQTLIPGAPVGQPGKRIGQRERLEAVKGVLALGEDHDEPRDLRAQRAHHRKQLIVVVSQLAREELDHAAHPVAADQRQADRGV